MADRQDSDREVLTSLPRSRPVRRSDKRAARPATTKSAAKATAKPKPAARAKPKPKATAKAAAKPAAKARARPAAARPRPAAATTEPSVAPRRKIPPAGYAAPTSQAPDDPVNASADLVGTAIQAAGELAQIGFAVGRQTLRSMLDRLPRP